LHQNLRAMLLVLPLQTLQPQLRELKLQQSLPRIKQ
jgi:hypothetical protein